jgi:hypothetical protein
MSEFKKEETSDDFIDNIFLHNLEVENEIKKHVRFDILFKLQGGNTSNDVLLLSNYSLNIIEKLNKKIKDIKKQLSNEKYNCPFNIAWAFKEFFKFEGQKDSKGYNSFIFKWILQFFQENYDNNPHVNNVFIKKSEHIVRNKDKKDIKSLYNNLLTNFKFLKLMEKNGFNKENSILNSQSYKLGKSLGEFCQTWQDDRKNLVRYVQNFNGQISRNIKDLNDVNKHYVNFLERLVRNKCRYIKTNEFNHLFNNFDEKFDSVSFIRGYFDSQYSFKEKEQNN